MCIGADRDLLRRLSDQDQLLDLAIKTIDPLIINGLLVITTTDQDCPAVHGTDALDRGIRVGSLGIVVKGNVILFADKLDTVFYCMKGSQSLPDSLHRHAHAIAKCNRCHNIFIIVCT